MITIKYNGSIDVIINAVIAANKLLCDENFYQAISQKERFDYSQATGREVAHSLHKCNVELTVKTFKKLFTRELGYEVATDPTSIYINVAGGKLNRSPGSIAGTFIHEAVHAADADDDTENYPHNGNSVAGNEHTAPYWIGNLAVQMIDNPEQEIDVQMVAAVAHAPEEFFQPFAEGKASNPDVLSGASNFTLSVTVKNGERPPTDIKVTLDGPAYHQFYTRPESFSKPENLQRGAYDMNISGSNPFEGTTEIALSGNFDGDPSPSVKETRDTKEYSVDFSFIIA